MLLSGTWPVACFPGDAAALCRAGLRSGWLGDMSETTTNTEHDEDPNRPGWCAVCGAAYPCPGTATAEEARRLLARYGRS